jgi:hypothetical protein
MYNPDKLFIRKIKKANGIYVPAKTRKIKNVFDKKLIVYGNECLLTLFNFPIYTYSEPNRPDGSYIKKEKGQKRQDNISKSRNELYMLAKANEKYFSHKPIFLTLTFDPKKINKDIIQDRKKTFQYTQHMFRKLKRYGYKPKYIGITERQKNNNIHYHFLVYDLPFITIQEWQKYWPHGYIDVKVLDSIDNVSAYFVKYMTKEFLTDDDLNNKLYFTSRGLNRPLTLYKKNDIEYYYNRAIKTDLISEKHLYAQQQIKKYKLILTN